MEFLIECTVIILLVAILTVIIKANSSILLVRAELDHLNAVADKRNPLLMEIKKNIESTKIALNSIEDTTTSYTGFGKGCFRVVVVNQDSLPVDVKNSVIQVRQD